MATADKQLGLPEPQITTIFPSARPLPPSARPAWSGWAATGRAPRGRARQRSTCGRAPDRSLRQDRDLRDPGGQRDHRRRREPGRPAGDDAGTGVHQQQSPGQRDLDQRRHRRDHLQPRAGGDPRAGPRRADGSRGGHPGPGRHRRLWRVQHLAVGQRPVRGLVGQAGHRGLGRLPVGHGRGRQRAEPHADRGRKAGPDLESGRPGARSPRAPASRRYSRGPRYQNGVAGITGSAMRSVPDITMDAQAARRSRHRCSPACWPWPPS